MWLQQNCVRGLHVQLGDVYCVCMCKYSMHIHEFTKPATPEQARIRAMQAQVRQAQQRVKAERLRQQQARLTQQRGQLNQLQ